MTRYNDDFDYEPKDRKRDRNSLKEQRKAARANKFANATAWQDEDAE